MQILEMMRNCTIVWYKHMDQQRLNSSSSSPAAAYSTSNTQYYSYLLFQFLKTWFGCCWLNWCYFLHRLYWLGRSRNTTRLRVIHSISWYLVHCRFALSDSGYRSLRSLADSTDRNSRRIHELTSRTRPTSRSRGDWGWLNILWSNCFGRSPRSKRFHISYSFSANRGFL